MGFDTIAIINNDCLHEMKKDPELGEKIDLAIARVGTSEKWGPATFPGGRIVTTFHASGVCVVAVGGRTASILGWGIGTDGSHSSPEDQEKILRQVVDKLGFRLEPKAGTAPEKMAFTFAKQLAAGCIHTKYNARCTGCVARRFLKRHGYVENKESGRWRKKRR